MSQLQAFLLCASFGALGGVCYEPFFCAAYLFRSRVPHIAADLLFCIVFAAGYLFFSTAARLPPLRAYLVAGLALGFWLYLKSIHKIVAFFADKVYNTCVRLKNNGRNQKKCREKKGRSHRKRPAGSR